MKKLIIQVIIIILVMCGALELLLWLLHNADPSIHRWNPFYKYEPVEIPPVYSNTTNTNDNSINSNSQANNTL